MSTADLDVGLEKPSIRPGSTCPSATLSLIFGVLSFVALPLLGGILAVLLGFSALGKIRESHDQLRGAGSAKAGIALGFLNLALGTITFLLLVIGYFFVRANVAPMEASHTFTTYATTPTAPAAASLTPGVKMANEIGRSEYDLIQKLQLASEDDPAICVYNASADSYNPELAVLTAKMISYVKDDRITRMDLADITGILDHRKYMEKYQPNNMGYQDQFNIEIKGKDGSRMRVVVRPSVDGPSFYEALNDAWKAAGGDEPGATTEISSPKQG